MADALVIVESPAKAKTINKFLGRGYRVEPSMGHVRDLPKKELGVDVENGFTPHYEVIATRKKVLDKLTKEALKAERIIVATDPDREGEAIGWHLAEVLGQQGPAKPVLRVMFNEITKHAVLRALENPTLIDKSRVDAQQARRILDRLMGYRLSPLLWDKVRRGLSAGRVQSVALRIVCEREDAIEAFVPVEYWVVTAQLLGQEPPEFAARLKRRGGKELEVHSKADVDAVLAGIEGATWKVSGIETKERRKTPQAPYITSRFQQEASRMLRLPVSRAMQIAQSLYEGKDVGTRGTVGLITYMRTDSTRVADSAITDVRDYVTRTHGDDYLPPKPNVYRSKKGAQDAHEAIRPTYLDLPPESVAAHLTRDELRVYTLIWNRFVGSQMKPALFDETIVEIDANGYAFEARGSVLKFAGFLKVYQEGADEDVAPDTEPQDRFPRLAVGDTLKLIDLATEQKFTQPPPRFTEATLVKELEENGIGRPSTYASILQTLRQREYTETRENRFHPTELGRLVNTLLVGSFGDLLDVGYTAKLEDELDDIEEGRRDWIESLSDFNRKFAVDLERAHAEMRNVKTEAIETDESCDKCTKPMVLRWGRFGRFLACSGYPECKNTREQQADMAQEFDEPCPHCSKKMAPRKGRFGTFLACPDYPRCRGTARLRPQPDGSFLVQRDRKLDEACPQCGNPLMERQGRNGTFVSCSTYPKCEYTKQEKVGVACPNADCGGDLVVKRSHRGKVFYGCSRYPACDYVVWDKPIAEPCPQCAAPFVLLKETKRFGSFKRCAKEECGWTDAPPEAKKAIRKPSSRSAAPARRAPRATAAVKSAGTAAPARARRTTTAKAAKTGSSGS